MRLLSLLFVFALSLTAAFPGIRTSIGMNSLNSLKNKYLPELISALTSSVIPSESFNFNAFLIPCKITLSNISIQDFNMNQAASGFITTDSTSTIYLSLVNVTFHLKAEYHYNYPIFSSGNVTIQFTQSNLSVPITLTLKSGMLSGKVGEIQMDENTIEVNFATDGYISRFFGIFFKVWPLKNIAQYSYKNAIERTSTLYNAGLTKIFNSIHYNDAISGMQISNDFHFFSCNITSAAILLEQNGTFYLTNSPNTLSPVTPPSFIPSFTSKNSLRIQFTEYFFDSFMWSMYASGSLNFFIKSEKIPKTFPYTFTTTGLNKLIPNFSASYGAGLPVDLQCSVYKIPGVTIQSTITVFASMYCDFMVRVSESISVAAFRILTQLESNFVGELSTVENTVYLVGNLDELNTQFNNFVVTNSNIGNFNTAALAKAVNWYAYYIVLAANKIFSTQGIALPLPQGIALTQSKLYIYAGALEVGGEPILS